MADTDKNYLYSSPFLINIKKYGSSYLSSYYLMDIDEDILLDYKYVNDRITDEFIVNKVNIKKIYNTENKQNYYLLTFNLTTSLSPNVLIQEESITDYYIKKFKSILTDEEYEYIDGILQENGSSIESMISDNNTNLWDVHVKGSLGKFSPVQKENLNSLINQIKNDSSKTKPLVFNKIERKEFLKEKMIKQPEKIEGIVYDEYNKRVEEYIEHDLSYMDNGLYNIPKFYDNNIFKPSIMAKGLLINEKKNMILGFIDFDLVAYNESEDYYTFQATLECNDSFDINGNLEITYGIYNINENNNPVGLVDNDYKFYNEKNNLIQDGNTIEVNENRTTEISIPDTDIILSIGMFVNRLLVYPGKETESVKTEYKPFNRGFNESLKIIFESKNGLFDDYFYTNTYETYSNIKFFYDLNNLIHSNVTLANNGSSKFLVIDSVPVIGSEYFNNKKENKEYILKTMKEYLNVIGNSISVLEDNFDIDMKLYNTYGPSKLLTTKDKLNVQNTNIILHFTVKLENGTTVDELVLKRFISNYINKCNSQYSVQFFVFGLITEVQKSFSNILYMQFDGIENLLRPEDNKAHGNETFLDTSYQYITYEDTGITNAKQDIIPEYLTVDRIKNPSDYSEMIPNIQIKFI